MRTSTYENPDYQKAAPFAGVTIKAMQTAYPNNPCTKPVPCTGITVVRQNISGALAKMSVDQALKDSQAATERAVKQAGYLK